MNKKIIIGLVIIAVIILVILYRKGKLNAMKSVRLLKYFELKEFDTTALPSELGQVATYVNKYGQNKVVGSGEKNMDRTQLLRLDHARDIIEKGWNKEVLNIMPLYLIQRLIALIFWVRLQIFQP